MKDLLEPLKNLMRDHDKSSLSKLLVEFILDFSNADYVCILEYNNYDCCLDILSQSFGSNISDNFSIKDYLIIKSSLPWLSLIENKVQVEHDIYNICMDNKCSIISIPFKFNRLLIGSILLLSANGKISLSEEKISYIESIIGIAFRSWQHRKIAERHSEALNSFVDLTNILLSNMDSTELFNRIAMQAKERLGADIVLLYECTENGNDVIVPPIIKGELYNPDPLGSTSRKLPHQDSIVYKMLRHNKPVYGDKARLAWKVNLGINRNSKELKNDFIAREKIVSAAGIRLEASNKPVGVMFLNYRDYHYCSESQRNSLTIFANQAAQAIRNSRIISAQKRHEKQLMALNQLATKLQASINNDEQYLYKSIYQCCNELLSFSTLYIAKYHPKNNSLIFLYINKDGKELISRDNLFKNRIGQKGVAEYLIEKEPFIMLNTENDLSNFKSQGFNTISSNNKNLIGCSMATADNNYSVLCIQNEKHDKPYTSKNIDTLKSISSQVSIAMDNALIYAEERKKRLILDRLEQGVRNIKAAADKRHLSYEIVRHALDIIGCTAGIFFEVFPQQNSINILNSKGFKNLPGDIKLDWGHDIISKSVIAKSIKTYNKNIDDELPNLHFLDNIDVKSACCVPISGHGYEQYMLALFDLNDSDCFDSLQIEAIDKFSLHITNVLMNLDPGNKLVHTAMMASISNFAQRSLDINKTLRVFLTGITANYGLCFNRAAIFTLDKQNKTIIGKLGIGHLNHEENKKDWDNISIGTNDSFEKYIDVLSNNPIVDTPLHNSIYDIIFSVPKNPDNSIYQCLTSLKANIVNDNFETAIGKDLQNAIRADSQTAVIPIYSPEKVIGILIVDNKFSNTPITQYELEYLVIIANMIAVSITNDQLIKDLRDSLSRLKTVALVGIASSIDRHELRAKMTNILLGTNLITANLDTTCFNNIKSYLYKINDMATRVMNAPKIEFSSDENIKTIDLNLFLENLHIQFSDNPEYYDVKFKYLPPKHEGKYLVAISERAVKMAINLIITNAIRAFKDISVRKIKWFLRSNSNTYDIYIMDNGPGIKEDIINSIFKKVIKSSQSYGLGLLLSKTIFEANGADIKLFSSTKKGTVFKISFPINKSLELASE